MEFISHRGNINGRNYERENTVSYIREALDAGFLCEVDVLNCDLEYLYIGHDKIVDKIKLNRAGTGFLNFEDRNVILHIKHYKAMKYAQRLCVEYFAHNKDEFALTSYDNIWTCDYNIANENNGILMHKEMFRPNYFNNIKHFCGYGICSDYIEAVRNAIL